MQLCVSHDWVKKIPFTKALLQMSVIDQFRRNWAFPLGLLKLHIFYTWPVWKCVPSDLSLDTSSESAYKHTHTNYFAYSIKKKSCQTCDILCKQNFCYLPRLHLFFFFLMAVTLLHQILQIHPGKGNLNKPEIYSIKISQTELPFYCLSI